MKKIIFLLISLHMFVGRGQENLDSVIGFTVSGKVKKDVRLTLSDIQGFVPTPVPDLPIRNHKGELKHTVKGLSGILVKELLAEVEFDVAHPKVLSELYLTFLAADGYKVVYSWNEIFNSTTGDHLFLITSKEGVNMDFGEEGLLVVTTNDINTGRRYIKKLSKIIVDRVP